MEITHCVWYSYDISQPQPEYHVPPVPPERKGRGRKRGQLPMQNNKKNQEQPPQPPHLFRLVSMCNFIGAYLIKKRVCLIIKDINFCNTVSGLESVKGSNNLNLWR